MAVSDTLRGYRTQFLYTIYRVLTSKDKEDEVFHPEGTEDLDVLADGKVIECIQVKNYLSGDVKYSDLQSAAHSTSFFRRGTNTLKSNPNARLVLFSYHGIDKSLTNKKQLAKKLSGDKYEDLKQREVQRFITAFETEQKDEKTLIEEISSILKQLYIASDPNVEIQYLTQWVYEAAENKQTFTYADLLGARLKYVSYLNKYDTVMKSLGVTIKCLNEGQQDFDIDSVITNYRSGVSARMCHIQAGLDVIRTAKMETIDNAFRKSNVVIIHGASGQGKSTLAYRYIYDCCPMAYEITSSNANNIDEIIATLSALIKDLRCKITFFLDVEPSNLEWIKVLGQFGESQYAQCIVTIRQEDLNQQRHTLDKAIKYSEIGIELTREEAKGIYDQISMSGNTLPSFAQVWEEVGIHGTMLEYMYHLTHGESLQARIADQVSKISGSKRTLLAYIVIGNYLGGRIQKERIGDLDEIDILEAEEVMPHWKDEFYCVNADKCLTDVHPIRTMIIMNEIFHENLSAKVKFGLELYKKVRVNQVDTYLIRLLMEGMNPDDLIQWTNEHEELSPIHYYGICKALYWQGIQDYLQKHSNLIKELQERVGELWAYYLPINFTEIDIYENLRKLTLQFNPNFPEVNDILKKFDHQTTIFKYLEKWLNGKTLKLNVTSGNDWVKTGQLLYLLSLIGHKDVVLIGSTENIDILDLQDQATVLLGLKSIPLSNYVEVFEENFLRKLRRTFHIIRFKRSEQELYVKSFIDYYGKDDDAERKGFITEHHNMKILNLCRRAFPNEKKYHAELLNDVVMKSFGDIPLEKNIARVDLPLDEMTEPRQILMNIHKRTYHPIDRTSYAQDALRIREEYAKTMFRLANSLEKWSANRKNYKGLQTSYLEADALKQTSVLLIPRSEISEYGFGNFNSKVDEILGIHDQKTEQEFELLHKLLTGYMSNLQNFIQHSIRVLVGDNQYSTVSTSCLYDAFEGITKMQSLFKRLLNEYVPGTDVLELEKKELSNIKLLWVLWEQYIKDSDARLDSTKLLNRFEEKEKYFTSNVIKQINEYILDELAIGHAEPYGDKIRLTYTYIDEYSKENLMNECIGRIMNLLSDYDYFSSERLILSRNHESVWFNPILVGYGRYSPNIDNHYVSISINALFASGTNESDLKRFPSYDIDADMYEQNPKLEIYISFMGHMMLINMYAMKLQLAYANVENDDELGVKVIEDYAVQCQRRIKENLKYFDGSETLDNLLIHDTSHDAIIEKVVSKLERFYHNFLDMENWWMLSSDLLESMQELLENDWIIKTALVKADDY